MNIETGTKNKIDNELDKNKINEETKRKALEKVKQKVTIINIEEIAEAERRKGADDYMTEDKASGLKKWWKHTVAEGFYRQREVGRVGKEIQKTGNIYTRRVGDNPDKTAHKNMEKGITDRFSADYEDSLVLSKGEERKFLDDKDTEVIQVKTDLKDLLDSYAMGQIDDETFNNNKKGIIARLKDKEDLFKGADNYADNLFEIAQNAKIAYEHGAKLGELDYDLGLIIGKAKSSLKTEAHFNWIDKGIDKMKKNGVGKFISPTVLSTSVGIAYSVITGVNALASTKLGQVVGGVGSLGITVGISTAFAAANESQRVADERKQHGLEMAEGGEYKAGSKRREEMAKYEYVMEKSTDLSQELRNLMFEKDKDGNDVVKDIKESDVQDIIACLGNIDARKSLNASKKIDLISYSNLGNVEKESTDLTILTAQAKTELEKRVKTDLKNGLPQGVNSYEEYLESVTNTVKNSLLGGEKGINAQDRTYRGYKAWRVAKKSFWTATIGLIAGATIRELLAIGSDHVQGLFNNPDGTTTVTPARHLLDLITGNQTHMDMSNSVVTHIGNLNLEIPEGVSVLQNGNGIDIIKGGHVISHFIPKLDADGALDPTIVAKLAHEGILSSSIHNVINSTQEISTDANGWIQNHPGETVQVHHVHDAPFADNNTPSIPDSANPGHMLGADGNELGMRWGGPDGSGVNANGDTVLNISGMDSIHSVHGDVSVDVPTEMQNGNLMALIYLNGGGQGIPVDVQPNGEIIFDHNNPIMQQVFTKDASGHMVNHAKVIELVQKLGVDKNGVLNIRGISAIVGEGLKKIIDIIPCHDDIVVNTIIPPVDVQSVLFVPTVSRKPLEPIIFSGKEKAKENKSENIKDKTLDKKVDFVGVPETKTETKTTNEIVKEKTEKETAIELSQEEYDAMKDDLKMLNSKIMTSAGIITLTKESFKSEYGKKRYLDLKSIPAGKSKEFNRTETELQKIGNEIEGILSKAKVVSKEELAKRLEKENKNKTIESDLRSDLEMLNKTLSGSKGIITLDESSFMSDFGKEKYKKLKSIPRGKNFEFNRDELGKIGDEMAKYLSNYQSIGKTKINETAAENNPIIKTEEKIKENKNSDTEIKKSNTKIDSKKEETKINNLELNKNNIEVNKILSKEALTKIGTKFVSKEGEYIITKISKGGGFMGMFSKTNVEVIYKNSKGVETLITYNKNDLEKELEKGNIQIIKNENNKKTTENNIDEKDADFELNKFINQISLLLLDATDEHLSKEPELKIFAVKAYPTIINDFKKDFGSMNKKEEEETMEEFTTICKDKKKFIEAMKKFQKSGVLV